jgi:hypothetical protein
MHYRHYDTKEHDGVYVTFERVTLADDCLDAPHQRDEGMSTDREADYYAGKWEYIGIMARAVVRVVRNGNGTIYVLESAGLFGIESDSGDECLNEVFQEEKNSLLADLKFIGHTEIIVKG